MVIENIKDLFGYSSKSLPSDFCNLIKSLKAHQKINQETFELLYDAYCFGKKAHEGQKRKSGEPTLITVFKLRLF